MLIIYKKKWLKTFKILISKLNNQIVLFSFITTYAFDKSQMVHALEIKYWKKKNEQWILKFYKSIEKLA